MTKVLKNQIKKWGGMLFILLFLITGLAGQAFADGVRIHATELVGGLGGRILNNAGAPLTAGYRVQIIQAVGGIDAPDPDDAHFVGGNDVWIADIIVGGVEVGGAAGALFSNQPAISGVTIYLRAWEGAAPGASTRYGDSATQAVPGAGSPPINWEVPTFSTDDTIPEPEAHITRTPTTINITITEGENAGSESFSVGNTGDVDLVYTLSESVSWISSLSRAGGTVAPGGSQSTNINFATSGLVADASTNISIRSDGADNSPQTVRVNITVEPPGSPRVTSISPNNGDQGETVSVTINGADTSWSGAESVSVSGSGVTVSDASATSATRITATFTIAADAAAGARTVTVAGAAGSATFTVNGSSGDGPNITSVTSADENIYVGETIVINGTDFEEHGAASAVTVGGVAANPTEWTDARITIAVPSGVSAGAADVAVTNASGSDTESITIVGGGVVIDDIERGPVGSWAFDYDTDGANDSGYYGMGTGIDPAPGDTFGDNAVQATAAQHGTYGIRVQYSHDGGWGGGWGGQLSNALDISGHDTLSFYIAWDGSSNEIKFAFRDSADHIYAATVSNTTLSSGTGYKRVAVPMSAFSEDTDNAERTPGAIDWTDIAGYEVAYTTDGTTTGYQHIDSIAVGVVDWGGDEPTGESEVLVDRIEPARGPAGTRFTAFGNGFGDSQGSSILIFENSTTRTNYEVEILSWSDVTIEAIVPKLAPIGDYTVKVIRIAISAGSLSAFESTPHAFEVTNNLTSSGVATVFPNPFNPLETSVPVSRASGMSGATATIAYDATGITNIGIYIYDTTAKLVFHETTSASQIGWDGTDMNGNHVADGVYLLRVVNEETKSLISKGKILVVKQR